ncbi:MAG: RteC domain-containing protein [Mucilaginibacter polytrichastri]|nr:RteC domain-containing protein [Mucilaginibacter polytrichastri]
MLDDYCNTHYAEMTAMIRDIHPRETDSGDILRTVLDKILREIDALKSVVSGHVFDGPEDEIRFFKGIVPRFYQWQIYYAERLSLDLQATLREHGPEYYRDALRVNRAFFRKHAFAYQYFKLEASHLDALYFVPGALPDPLFIPALPDVNPVSGTQMSFLFAKFMAYERMQNYLMRCLERFQTPGSDTGKPVSNLRWTGDKTNLVELIYGMYYTGQLNDGNAKVAEIIRWMEEQLQIDLSRAYRSFIDIRNRKRESQTRFLDKMRSSIHERVEADNAYQPASVSRKNNKDQ